MKQFAELIFALDTTTKTKSKIGAIERFLTIATDLDKLWLLALFTKKRPKRPVKTSLMRLWVQELTDIPSWLFDECYASVGDLSETISLLLPPPEYVVDRSLSEWMKLLAELHEKSDEEKRKFVIESWSRLPHRERFIFNKLIGGSFRIGVSSKTMVDAISQHFGLDPDMVTHSLMGDWKIDGVEFDKLITGQYTNTQISKPYPFSLAYAIDSDVDDLGDLADWQVEYKWDGIRGQVVKREGEVFIWSRGVELVNDQFPELVEAFSTLHGSFVLDGEILVVLDGKVAPFSSLQKRLNRKTISKRMLIENPVSFYVYDIMELEGNDLRNYPLENRRELLENFMSDTSKDRMLLSPILTASNWEKVKELQGNARDMQSEGVMLKRKNSIYHVGRKKGDWWKWKVDPMTIDAVLIYAQKGSGRRSGYYTDYTFAVRDGENLVTIAKAYSGLTDKEIQEVSRFVNRNALEKFGPVRTVKPALVFEIAFEGISMSNRHKSGVALRFPRILRWRRDKIVSDIDTIEEVKKLIVV